MELTGLFFSPPGETAGPEESRFIGIVSACIFVCVRPCGACHAIALAKADLWETIREIRVPPEADRVYSIPFAATLKIS